MIIRWQSIWTWKQEFLWVVPLKLAGVWGHQDDEGRQDKQLQLLIAHCLTRYLGKLLQSCSTQNILDSLQGSSETKVSTLKSPRLIISFLQTLEMSLFPSYQRPAPHSRGCRFTVNIAKSQDFIKSFLIFSCSKRFWSQVITWQSWI